MQKLKVCLGILLLVGYFALGGGTAPLQAQSSDYLYWTTGATIGRVGLDGSDYKPLFISVLNFPEGTVFNPHGIAINEKYIYWTNRGNLVASISRANLDGTGEILDFIPGLNSPNVCAIDDNYIYWLNIFTQSPTIGRAKLDRTETDESFIRLTDQPRGIAVSGDYIYWGNVSWGNSIDHAIGRTKVDGTGVGDEHWITYGDEHWITELTYNPHGIMVTQDYIYWANHEQVETSWGIVRAELDGTEAQVVFPGPFGNLMSVVTRGDMIYWGTQNGWLGRAKLDGTEYEPHWKQVGGCVQLAITPQRYTFEGFFSPIDNIPTVNKANAGQTIPIKWKLTDKNGLPVSDPASFISIKSLPVDCATYEGDPINYVEEPASGSSGLQYLGDGWWQFNWKTSKTYSGQCRTMKLTLDDHSEHTANFSFK